MKITGLGIFLVSATAALAASGCDTQSYCFSDCDGDSGATDGSTAQDTGTKTEGGLLFDGGLFDGSFDGSTHLDGGPCTKSNNGKETCDNLDNDCNGKVDDIDTTAVTTCGGKCFADGGAPKNCLTQVKFSELATCVNGKCDYTKCDTDHWDFDKNHENGCETYCQKTADKETKCDKLDEDCNGKADDTFNLCADPSNCGVCGRNCQGKPHATGKCVSTAPAGQACTEQNTNCAIASCEEGWIDANGNIVDGCELKCTKTKRTNPADPATTVNCKDGEAGCGIEYCDGLDNDCDGKIDAFDPDLADPKLGDPNLGKDCKGSANGECAKANHIGVYQCVAAALKCVSKTTTTKCTKDTECTDPKTPYCIDGPNPPQKVCGTKVIKVNDQPEICNNLDDDCDGEVDDSTSDSGAYCGSNEGICTKGKTVCSKGTLSCSGQVDKQPEGCNGADDDCDGVIDGSIGANPKTCTGDTGCAATERCMPRNGSTDKVCATLPVDILGTGGTAIACDVPTPAPTGWTSACKAGVLSCQSGAKICVGSVKPSATQDSCNKDLDCNGIKNPDFNLANDVHNCGSCGNDCFASSAHIAWTCVAGKCTVPSTNKCAPGYIDCDGDPNTCERACEFLSKQELCNGQDDNCNCKVDEMKSTTYPDGIPAPSATQLCGTSPAATECSGVSVACTAGKWACTYPLGYCTSGNCATTKDTCDGKDNNCNGAVDEDFGYKVLPQGYIGQVCYSDDGLSKKHGLCQQSGTFQCKSATETACKNTGGVEIAGKPLQCGTGAGQSGSACTELCDGKDNDCDGIVDETYNVLPKDTYFVKPAVVKVATSLWVYAYEASRPTATATSSGSGNGWWRTSSLLTDQPGVPSGAGIVPDKTPACSAPTRVPWFNVTGLEAQHVCVEMGGRLCGNAEWQTTCKANQNRSWATSTGAFGGGLTCNLGPYDFSSDDGNQDGLLPTAWTGPTPNGIANTCYADWGAAGKLFDMTGNLRELSCAAAKCTSAASQNFILMGGAYNTSDPNGDGSKCDFSFYNVNQDFKLYDAGFRCCFDKDPTL